MVEKQPPMHSWEASLTQDDNIISNLSLSLSFPVVFFVINIVWWSLYVFICCRTLCFMDGPGGCYQEVVIEQVRLRNRSFFTFSDIFKLDLVLL